MPGSLQAVTERDIEIPEFDQDEKDTILARLWSASGRRLPGRISYCFLVLGLVNYY